MTSDEQEQNDCSDDPLADLESIGSIHFRLQWTMLLVFRISIQSSTARIANGCCHWGERWLPAANSGTAVKTIWCRSLE